MDTETKTLLLIFNPRAGRSKPHGPLFDAVALLSEGGYLVRIHRTAAAGDAAQTAAREGSRYDLVVASGGDGTLNEVISGLSQLEDPPLLGYLPQGSTNDFAASLRIPSDPERAAAAILRHRGPGTGHRPVESAEALCMWPPSGPLPKAPIPPPRAPKTP